MDRFRALLIGFAATVGAGGIAAYNGVFSTPETPAQIAATPASTGDAAKTGSAAPAAGAEAAKSDAVKPDAAKSDPAKSDPAKSDPAKSDAAKSDAAKSDASVAPSAATEAAKADPDAAAPAAAADTPAAPAAKAETAPAAVADMIAPTFDVLRVEPDGSVLIAGKAGKEAQIEVLSGADILGATKAEMNGDFAITLTNPLKPGDYQLVLRATGTDGKAATSVETATVSVPESVKGQVLALVEEPGKPSRIITAPEKPAETAPAAAAIAETKPADAAAETKPAATADVALADTTPDAAAEVPVGGDVKAPATDAVAVAQSVVIEAVETEGGKIFIAGSAKGVSTVRIYANDQALGDAKPGEGDRFLGEFQKDLAVGDYIIKAEGLAADGATVITTSSVPFQRQADVAAAAETPAPAAAGTAAAPAAAPAADAAQIKALEPVKPKAVIIRRGDTLWQISRRVYGHGVRYSTIYLANQDAITNPNRIFPGQVFKVPEKTPEGEAADPAEIEKRAAPAENTPAQ